MNRGPNRNKNNSSHDTCWYGECSRFHVNATLTIHLSAKRVSQYDLQPTLTPYIKACNLLKEKGVKDMSCMLSCPIFEEYRNSHDC